MSKHVKLGIVESIALYAFLTAVTALSLDITLPAYSAISEAFGVAEAELQHSILLFVTGMLLGELLAGALADRYGRRVALALSAGVFCVGTVMCLLAPTYAWLLIGRVLQGVGAAGQKICTRAIIRDRYTGAAMARVMSYVLAVFVALPFISPLLGSMLTQLLGWRSIFTFLSIYSFATFLWFRWRHPETLPAASFSSPRVGFFHAARIFFHNNRCVWLTMGAGLLFGIHLSFISLSPLIFADNYQIVEQFPLYFGSVVCAFGVALILNAKYVERTDMVPMVITGLVVMTVSQTVFMTALTFQKDNSLVFFLAYGFFTLFSLGLVFGNLTALVLQPVGHIAGVASAISSALSTLVALLVSSVAGVLYAESLFKLAVLCEIVTIMTLVIFLLLFRTDH